MSNVTVTATMLYVVCPDQVMWCVGSESVRDRKSRVTWAATTDGRITRGTGSYLGKKELN